MGDFDLQPLRTSVQNLVNSQIKLCFILHGGTMPYARLSMNTQMTRNTMSLESQRQWYCKLPDLQICNKQHTSCRVRVWLATNLMHIYGIKKLDTLSKFNALQQSNDEVKPHFQFDKNQNTNFVSRIQGQPEAYLILVRNIPYYITRLAEIRY